MHHGHGPHGHGGNSPHGGYGPHGHGGHSPHGGHGAHGGHGPHGGHGDYQKEVNQKPQVRPQQQIQPRPPIKPEYQTMPQPQPIPQPQTLVNQDTNYSSHLQANHSEPQVYPINNFDIPLQEQITFQPDLGYNSGQQQGMDPQTKGGYYPQKPPESSHEHPLNYANSVNAPCKICQQNIIGQPGYNCGSCDLILCLNCAQKAFYGQKNDNIHPHSLTLKMRKSWKCDLCKKSYRNVVSFYCKSCDYDVCPSCYVAY